MAKTMRDALLVGFHAIDSLHSDPAAVVGCDIAAVLHGHVETPENIAKVEAAMRALS